jgi:phage-related protein
MMESKRLQARFFKMLSGSEPVREWLKELTKEDKKSIGGDINAVERTWPVGLPLVRKLDSDLWEVRTNLSWGICRVFFTIFERYMVLLHGIIKKTQKTPIEDLKLAKKRRNIVLRGGVGNE